MKTKLSTIIYFTTLQDENGKIGDNWGNNWLPLLHLNIPFTDLQKAINYVRNNYKFNQGKIIGLSTFDQMEKNIINWDNL